MENVRYLGVCRGRIVAVKLMLLLHCGALEKQFNLVKGH